MLRLPFLIVGLCMQMVAQASDTRLTMNLDGVSVESALRSIARQANLQLAMKKSVLPKKLVSLKLDQVSASQAITQVLAGTGLVADISKSGILTIIEADARVTRHAGQGVIAGKIVDSKTGKGVAGAKLSVDNDHPDTRVTASDENGSYRITGVSVGSHTVVVRLVGYAKQTRAVTVGEGATVSVDFRLEPSASVLDQVVVTGTVIASELRSVPNAITVITAKQIEERGITRIDQLFRGDIPGLFSLNLGSGASLDEVTMFSRGATALTTSSVGTNRGTNPIKTYIDGVEMANPQYLSQIDPASIERIEILTGPQASTIYGSNAINGVMQIFTKRGTASKPLVTFNLISGAAQNNFSSSLSPSYLLDTHVSGTEGRYSYSVGNSWNYLGSWTPGKQTQRLNIDGGGRMDRSKFTTDINGRYGLTRNRQNGEVLQKTTQLRASGIWSYNSTQGLPVPQFQNLVGQTLGLTVRFIPFSWWSHEMVMGTDASTIETRRSEPFYQPGFSGGDTTLFVNPSKTFRTSQRYSTTIQIPVSSFGRFNLTIGGDHWRLNGSSSRSSPLSLTGNLLGSTVTRNHPNKNSGTFVQGQLGVLDVLFLTYGIRSDWNPNFGDKARVLPGRYGISITRDVGLVSAKLRGSYGKSIRPPADALKLGSPATNTSFIQQYGAFDGQLANLYLDPEDRKGGEGGIELYFGNRSSIVVTRFNETTNNLISPVNGADSVRSLTNTPDGNLCQNSFRDAEGYCYVYQLQYLNVGSIRNQGWETTGSINLGPLTTRGTYSWTKSRIIGITPKYRSLLTGTQYQAGRSFDYLPEHTWALNLTYSRFSSTVSLSVNGITTLYRQADAVSYASSVFSRLNEIRPRINPPTGYRPLGSGYTTADINATKRFSSGVDALLQVNNLTNYYQNDFNGGYATLGRQTKFGLRWRIN